MKIKFILTACIVSFGITSVQPHLQKENKAAISGTSGGGGRVADNVFDALKEEMLLARVRNTYKKQNFLKKANTQENVVAIKRETNERNLSTETSNCEDKFVEHFGNPEYLPWVNALKWFNEDLRWKMNMICNDAYKIKHPKESYFIEDVGFMENITLLFKSSKYRPMITDVLEFRSRHDERYGGLRKKDDRRPEVQNWLLTQGRTDDCVHYVKAAKEPRQVTLMEEVCGITLW